MRFQLNYVSIAVLATAMLAGLLPAEEFEVRGKVVDDSIDPQPVAAAHVMLSVRSQPFKVIDTDASGSFTVQPEHEGGHITFELLVHQGRRYVPWTSQTLTAKSGSPFHQDGITLKRFTKSTVTVRQVTIAEELARRVDPNGPMTRELGEWSKDLQRPKEVGQIRIVVPAYFYPGGPELAEWEKLIQTAKSSKVMIYAIVNPGNGVGAKVNPDYTAIMAKAKSAGLRTIGYVSTRHGKRPLDEVKNEIATWKKMYPSVGGIFVDEMSTDIQNLEYYEQINSAALAAMPKGEVLMNPGTPPGEAFISRNICNACMLFENVATAFEGFAVPDWVQEYPTDRFGVLVYNDTEASKVRSRIAWAKKNGVGWVFFTDRFMKDGNLHPWHSLPTFWKELVAEIAKSNASK